MGGGVAGDLPLEAWAAFFSFAEAWRPRPVGSVLFLISSSNCAASRSLAVAIYAASAISSAARLPGGGESGRTTRSWGLRDRGGFAGTEEEAGPVSNGGSISVKSGRNRGSVVGGGGTGRRGVGYVSGKNKRVISSAG